MTRKWILPLILAGFLAGGIAWAESDQVFVVVDGKKLEFTQPPVLIADTVFVPIRDIALEIGAAVIWRDNTAWLQSGAETAGLQAGRADMQTADGRIPLPAAPVIIQDRMLVPLRAVSEALGGQVAWNPGTKGVYISPPEDSHRNYDKEKEVLYLVNQIRLASGLPAFAWDAGLASAARAHSRDMAENQFFSHTGLQGSSPFERMIAAGVPYQFAAENIAMGYLDPEQVVDSWMNSEGHRANILNGNLLKMGVGFYDNYWTQDFTN